MIGFHVIAFYEIDHFFCQEGVIRSINTIRVLEMAANSLQVVVYDFVFNNDVEGCEL